MAHLPPLPRQVRDTPEARELCERLAPGQEPQFVNIDAPPWAELNECIANVARVINEHGGEAAYGWRLWEPLPDLLIEAEFHVVWQDPGEPLLDVTPPFPGFTQTVFLPGPELVYEGQQIPNERVPLVDDHLVQEFVKALDTEFELMNQGELADYHGPVKLTPEMKANQARQHALFEQIARKHY
jgi:hypothetical protein